MFDKILNQIHWNHQVLPHWTAEVNKRYPIGSKHVPPDDLGSTFYPQLGPYSSNDTEVIDQHLKWFCDARIGTVAISYFAEGRTDDNGKPFGKIVEKVLRPNKTFETIRNWCQSHSYFSR